jgi:hypothetical protein
MRNTKETNLIIKLASYIVGAILVFFGCILSIMFTAWVWQVDFNQAFWLWLWRG